MADIATMLERLKKRVAKLERRIALERLHQAIDTKTMTVSEQSRVLEQIMQDCAAGTITTAQANRMTKAVKSNVTEHGT
jgi:hypothetical protein